MLDLDKRPVLSITVNFFPYFAYLPQLIVAIGIKLRHPFLPEISALYMIEYWSAISPISIVTNCFSSLRKLLVLIQVCFLRLFVSPVIRNSIFVSGKTACYWRINGLPVVPYFFICLHQIFARRVYLVWDLHLLCFLDYV